MYWRVADEAMCRTVGSVRKTWFCLALGELAYRQSDVIPTVPSGTAFTVNHGCQSEGGAGAPSGGGS